MKQTLKRMLSVALAVFLLMPVLSIVINAYEEGTYDFNVPKAVAPITADGFINELEWENALTVSLAESKMTKPLLKGNAKIGENSYLKMMWDENYIYYAFKIDDPVLIATAQIYLFGSNEDGFQGGPRICLSYKNGSFTLVDDVQHYDLSKIAVAGSVSDIGYVAEFMIPWTVIADMYAKGKLSASYTAEAGTTVFQEIMIMQSKQNTDYAYWSKLSNCDAWGSGDAASRFTLVNDEAGHYFDPASGPYSTPKAGTAPKIDAFADPDEWQNATNISLKASDIIWSAEGTSLNNDGLMNAMWDDNGFYGTAYIPDSTQSDNDQFKFVLFPNADSAEGLTFAVDRAGNVTLPEGVSAEQVEFAVDNEDKNSYIVEFSISKEALGIDEMASGKSIYANVIIVDANANGESVTGYIGEGTSINDAKDEYIFSSGSAGVAPVIPDYNQHPIGKATNAPKINGYINTEVNEWPKESYIGTLTTEYWGALQQPPENYDFRADIYAMWDATAVYYALDISDPSMTDSEKIRFDFFGTSRDAGMGSDTFTIGILPWTAYSSSPEIEQENKLHLDLAEYVKVCVQKVNSTRYQVEVSIKWDIFKKACENGNETAGSTFTFTGNYAGRAGTVFPLHLNYMDSFTEVNEDGETVNKTAWYLYYTGNEEGVGPFNAWTVIPNDVDTWLLTEETIFDNGIDETPEPAERDPENVYEIPRATGTIIPDGILGDEWKNAQVLDFSPENVFTVMNNNEGSLGAGSKAMFLWDNTYLYVGLDIKDATDTGYRMARGGTPVEGKDYAVDYFTLNFFSSLASTTSTDSLVFNFHPEVSDYTYKGIEGYSGAFEMNVNGSSSFITYKQLPTRAIVSEGEGYNYTMEIAIPWTLFEKYSKSAVSLGKTFKNFPVPEAGTLFRMAAEYRDNNYVEEIPEPAEGEEPSTEPVTVQKLSWYYHNYYKGVLETAWPFNYNTMDVFKLVDSTEVHKHELTKVEAKESTCTEEGNIEYYLCEGCGKMFKNADATGILYNEDVFLNTIAHDYAPAYDENEHYEECTMCHEKANAEAHEFGDWTVVKEADYGVKGERTRSCSGCEYVQHEEIPALVGATITIDNVEEAAIGEEFKAYVHLTENPGIVSLRFDVKYDMTKFELVSVKDLGALKGWTEPVDKISSPYRLRWCDPQSDDKQGTTNNKTEANIVELTFRVLDDVEVGEYEIEVIPVEAYQTVDKMNGKLINFDGSVAKINVVEGFIYGDVNNDKKVDEKDAVALARYLAGWNVTINMKAANVQYEENGSVDEKDAVKLARYLAGWNVVLGPVA